MRARVLVLALIAVLGWSSLALAAGRVVGKVVDLETSAPIEGAQVMLMVAPGATVTLPLTTQSDAKGAFQFDGVAPGDYLVQASKMGLASVFEATPEAAVNRLIRVAGDETVTTRDLVLRRGGVIAGRVVDAKGEPIADLMVQAETVLERGASGVTGGSVAVAPTNDLGEFRLAGVAPGEVRVAARTRPLPFSGPTGSTGYLATYYPSTPDRDRAVPMTLAAGQTIAGLEITMQRGSLFTVSGVVVTEAGAPVSDVTVTLAPQAAGNGGMGMARVDQNGAFTIRGVQAGSYRLVAMRLTMPAAPGSTAVAPLSGPGGTPLSTPVTVTDADVSGVRITVAVKN